jgi:type IV pilus assembly protein PilM
MSPNIVGMDIGSVSVRALELRNADRPKPIIEKFHEVPLPEGSVRRGEVLEIGTVAAAIKRLWSTGGFKTKDVILGMGGPRVLSRDLQMPRAPLAQIKEALPFHVQELLPVPVAEALLDFYPISEENGEHGPMVNGLLVAAIKEAVSANVAAVTQAGLRPIQVDLIPFALVRALAPVRGTTGMTAVVSIGANTTNIVVALDGIPQFVRIVSSGGDDITRALMNRLQLNALQAEAAKREIGLGGPSARPEQRPAMEVIYESARELLTAIRNTITYYVNGKNGMQLSRVVLSGGGSQLGGLGQALSEVLGVTVAQGDPLGGAQLSKDARSRATPEQQGAMTTAFGLALGTVK